MLFDKTVVPLESFSVSEILGSYYVNLDYFLKDRSHSSRIVFDERGIPMFKYGPPLDLQYNPTTVALHALRSYQCREFGYFFKLTSWLVEEMQVSNGKAFLFIRFPFPPRSYRSHWVSGMTQGLAISVMTRAYHLTKSYRFLELAKALASGMVSLINDGGCLYREGHDIFIEEYPEERPVRHVLNGLIFALFGLYDLNLVLNDRFYQEVIRSVTSTLERKIRLYDLGIWSRYDAAAKNFADMPYHFLNTVLLYVLARIMHSRRLRRISVRWFAGYKIFETYMKLKAGVRYPLDP